MRCPGLLCMMLESTHSFQHFRSRHPGSLCNCNMHLITRCLLIFLSCSFEACLLEVQSLSALLSTHVAQPIRSDNCERLLPLRSFVYFSREGSAQSVHNQLAFRRVVSIRPRYQVLTVSQTGLITCETVCVGQMTGHCRFTLAKK